jgi:threonine dehydrogenase-like Zn-dependent dehydrogenase
VFSEQVLVPRASLVPLPPNLDSLHAVLSEPLACCVGALGQNDVGAGAPVAVLGCGPIGLLTIYLAAREGADVTAVDPVPERRALAEELGAARAVAAADEIEAGSAELAVDAAGFEATWRGAIDSIRSGGTVVVLGLGQAEAPFPMASVVRRGLTVRGQFAYTRAEFARAVGILAEGDLDVGWLSTTALADGARAFADLVDRPAEYSKILLAPS